MARTRPVVEALLTAKDRASGTLQRAQGNFKRFTSSVQANFLKITAAAAAVVAAFRTIEEAATLESQTAALERNLAAQGQSLDGFLGKLDEVAQGTISTASLIKSSSQALLLGIPAEEISRLLEVARASAIATGQSVSDAFNDIATGIGRASPLILDNLGITVKLEDAYSKAAAAAGKTTAQLTEQEKKTALLNEVLRVGEERVQLFGDAQSGLATSLQQGQAAMENFRIGAGKLLSTLTLIGAGALTKAAQGFVILGRVIANVTIAISSLASNLPFVGDQFENLENRARQIDGRLSSLTQRLEQTSVALVAAGVDGGKALLGLSEQSEDTTDKLDKLRQKALETKGALDETREGAEDATEPVRELGDAADEAGGEFEHLISANEMLREELARLRDQADSTRESLRQVGQESAEAASFIVGQGLGGRPLFPGLSGRTFTHTIPQRTTVSANGSLVFR